MFTNFDKVNQWLVEHPMGKVTESLARLASLEGQVSPIMQQLAASYARSYALVQRLQYSESGAVTDVTPAEQLTVPQSVLAAAISNVERLKEIRDTIPEITLDQVAVTSALQKVEFFDLNGTNFFTVRRDGTMYLHPDYDPTSMPQETYAPVKSASGSGYYATMKAGWCVEFSINNEPYIIQLAANISGGMKLADKGKQLVREPSTTDPYAVIRSTEDVAGRLVAFSGKLPGDNTPLSIDLPSGRGIPNVYFSFLQETDVSVWDALINSMNYIDSALPILKDLMD